MFKTYLIPLVVLLAIPASQTEAQGTFQNLDFEAANIDQNQTPGFVSSTDALPGWSVYYGTVQQSQVLFNDPSVGATVVSLLGTNGPGAAKSIEGLFSVLLQGGAFAPDASIRQTGLVPGAAESLLFKAQPGNGALLVSLGGQSIPFVALSSGINYTLYGADVSSFAGQTLQLEFSAQQNLPGLNNWNLDSIQFSTSSIPEPSTLSLSVLGIFLFAIRRGSTNS